MEKIMNAYTGFAYVYDEYMDNIPYDEWSAYLIELLKENGIKKETRKYGTDIKPSQLPTS